MFSRFKRFVTLEYLNVTYSSFPDCFMNNFYLRTLILCPKVMLAFEMIFRKGYHRTRCYIQRILYSESLTCGFEGSFSSRKNWNVLLHYPSYAIYVIQILSALLDIYLEGTLRKSDCFLLSLFAWSLFTLMPRNGFNLQTNFSDFSLFPSRTTILSKSNYGEVIVHLTPELLLINFYVGSKLSLLSSFVKNKSSCFDHKETEN